MIDLFVTFKIDKKAIAKISPHTKDFKNKSKKLKDILSQLNMNWGKKAVFSKKRPPLKLKSSKSKLGWVYTNNKKFSYTCPTGRKHVSSSKSSNKSRSNSKGSLSKRTKFKRKEIIMHDQPSNRRLKNKIKSLFKTSKNTRNFEKRVTKAQTLNIMDEGDQGQTEYFSNPADTTCEDIIWKGSTRNFLDSLEFTDNTYLSSPNTELHPVQSWKSQYFTKLGFEEGLGEPELESWDQQKIIAKHKSKRRTSVLRLPEDKDFNKYDIIDMVVAPKTTRNNQIINFYDYDSDSSSIFKAENLSARLNQKTDLGALYDPAQIIKEFKEAKYHQHSKSSLSQEFQSLIMKNKQRPHILV